MIGILKRDVEIEWSRTGKKILLPENAVIEGVLDEGYFHFQWRNVGQARLSEKFFSFDVKADWTTLNKSVPRSVFAKGHKLQTGEKNANAKLQKDKVREIRDLLAEGKTLQQIANRFRVSRATIQKIKQNKSWNEKSKEAQAEKR